MAWLVTQSGPPHRHGTGRLDSRIRRDGYCTVTITRIMLPTAG